MICCTPRSNSRVVRIISKQSNVWKQNNPMFETIEKQNKFSNTVRLEAF
jgi:hypothetical protein